MGIEDRLEARRRRHRGSARTSRRSRPLTRRREPDDGEDEEHDEPREDDHGRREIVARWWRRGRWPGASCGDDPGILAGGPAPGRTSSVAVGRIDPGGGAILCRHDPTIGGPPTPMAKRARGSTTRPGQRPRLQRTSTTRPEAVSTPAPTTRPATLTAEEEARAAELEAQIVAEEHAADEKTRARSRSQPSRPGRARRARWDRSPSAPPRSTPTSDATCVASRHRWWPHRRADRLLGRRPGNRHRTLLTDRRATRVDPARERRRARTAGVDPIGARHWLQHRTRSEAGPWVS